MVLTVFVGESTDEKPDTRARIERLIRQGEYIVHVFLVSGYGGDHRPAQTRSRNKTLLNILPALAVPFIGPEDKHPVFSESAADRAAKLIKSEPWLCRRRLVARIQGGAGVVLEHGSVPLVSSRLHDHIDVT